MGKKRCDNFNMGTQCARDMGHPGLHCAMRLENHYDKPKRKSKRGGR